MQEKRSVTAAVSWLGVAGEGGGETGNVLRVGRVASLAGAGSRAEPLGGDWGRVRADGLVVGVLEIDAAGFGELEAQRRQV